MQTTVKPQTFRDRAAEATHALRDVVGIRDLKLLSASVAEAAAEEAKRNSAFAERIRAISEELSELQRATYDKPRGKVKDVELTPLPGTDGIFVDPYAPLDPYLLQRMYGPEQLSKALSVYGMTKLKEAAAVVMRRKPGVKPRDGRRIDSVRDFIVEQVAGA